MEKTALRTMALSAMIAILCLAVCASLCACSKKDAYTGYWEATEIVYSTLTGADDEVPTELDILVDGEGIYAIMLEDDGRAIWECEGQTYDGQWTQTAEGFRFTGPEWDISFKSDGNLATADVIGMDVTFKKAQQ